MQERSLFPRILCKLSLLAVVLLLSGTALAETDLTVTILPRKGTVRDVYLLKVTVAGRKRAELGEPSFSESNRFTIEPSDTAINRQQIGGTERFQISFNFRLRPRSDLKPGKYRLPPGEMRIGDEIVSLPREAVTILPGVHEDKQSVQQLSGVGFTQYVDNTEPFVGQQITYRIEIASPPNFLGGTLEDSELSGFWRESFGDKEKQTRTTGGVTIRSFLEVLIPTTSGVQRIPERYLTARIRVPSRRSKGKGKRLFGGSFLSDDMFNGWPLLGRSRTLTKRFISDPLTLNVRPLPLPPVANTGYIPVGSLRMKSSLNTRNIKQGESVTMKVTLSGSANLRPLVLRPAPSENETDFKHYDDKPRIDAVVEGDKIKYSKTFTMALVPKRAGNLQLPVFTVLSFDPFLEKYRLLKTKEEKISVSPSEEEQQLVVTTADGAARLPITEKKTRKKEVRIVGEDLLPQHVGAHTFIPARTLTNHMLAMIIIIVPALSVLLRLILIRRQELLSDPGIILQRNALQKALSQIAALESSPVTSETAETLKRIITTFLSERLRTRADTLTSGEIRELLDKHTGDPELSARIGKAMDWLQHLLYASTPDKKPVEHPPLVTDLKSILEMIEQRLSDRRRRKL